MNDPHVEWLRYRLELGPGLSFADPPALEHETDHFRLKLDAGKLTITMKEHHPSRESAQERVRPLLRAWELDEALTHGPETFRFVYEDTGVIDRNPPPPGGSRSIRASAGEIRIVGGRATLNFTGSAVRRAYPAPPSNFIASQDVETLWHRYRGHLEGKEPLPAMAFFCLTLVEALARGNRKKAARLLGMESEILNVLGALVTNKGDEKTIRKFPVSGVLPTLTTQEESWIRDVVRALIRQAGAHAAGVTPKPLTMADLPPLPRGASRHAR